MLYYMETGEGYEVVTTWLADNGRGPVMRHTAYLAPGQHYSLPLAGTGLPVELVIHSDAEHVVMQTTEITDKAIADLNPVAR